ncbi:MAG: hypothetical protein M1313_02520 [Nitrospirae bacterium]|nr:hypothetical protein [Nitrospirota bacterium]
MKKTAKTLMKKIFLAVALIFGMCLPACETTNAGSLLLLSGGDDPRSSRTIFGGLVADIRKDPATRRLSLTLREVRIGKDGHPRCSAPTGRLLAVESVTAVVSSGQNAQRSAFVIMENPEDRSSRELERGMCVTVRPDTREGVRGRIRLLPPPGSGITRDRVHDGIVEIWPPDPVKKGPASRSGLLERGTAKSREPFSRRAA